MKSPEEVAPIVKACLDNAESLIQAAQEVSKLGRYHIAYHLAALALEEIGKSSMVFMSALHPEPEEEDGEARGPVRWVDDHEKKLFWAVWMAKSDILLNWKTIPQAIEIAKFIHETRLKSLYVNPSF